MEFFPKMLNITDNTGQMCLIRHNVFTRYLQQHLCIIFCAIYLLMGHAFLDMFCPFLSVLRVFRSFTEVKVWLSKTDFLSVKCNCYRLYIYIYIYRFNSTDALMGQ